MAPTEIVTREISNYETVVKEIDPQEVIRKKRAQKEAQRPKPKLDEVSTEIPDLASFLDRLMLAESGGRDTAANPLSTALGTVPVHQVDVSRVARRHFPGVAELSDEQVLALRTTRHFARAAAAAFTWRTRRISQAAGTSRPGRTCGWHFFWGRQAPSAYSRRRRRRHLSQILGGGVLRANPS